MDCKMRVLVVVPSAYTADVVRALAFEGVDFNVFVTSGDAVGAVRERPDLIIGPGALLSWAHTEPSVKGVPFVAVDESGILSEDVALHAGAIELISLYEIPRENTAEWWGDTIHRLVNQYKPAHARHEQITVTRRMTPEERADHAAGMTSGGVSAIHVVVRNALVPVFREIDALLERIEKLEMVRT